MSAQLEYSPVVLELEEPELEMPVPNERQIRLEEKVENHIRFFWVVVGFGFLWLAGLSGLLWQINNNVKVGQQALSQKIGEAQLGIVRTAIETAQQTNSLLAETQLAEYKRVVKTTPQSSDSYWKTVAVVVNYQSLIDQVKGRAPNPVQVSAPCVSGGRDILFAGSLFTNCVVDLDGATFENVTFQDSVVRYKGQPTALANVRFVNCRFVLDLPSNDVAAPARRLLLTLLNSPSQTDVTSRS